MNYACCYIGSGTDIRGITSIKQDLIDDKETESEKDDKDNSFELIQKSRNENFSFMYSHLDKVVTSLNDALQDVKVIKARMNSSRSMSGESTQQPTPQPPPPPPPPPPHHHQSKIYHNQLIY